MKLPLHWKWFLGLAALLAVLLLVVYLCLGFALRPYLESTIRDDLVRDAVLAREIFAPKLASLPIPYEAVNLQCHELAQKIRLRVTVIAPDGTVIGESELPPEKLATIENHLMRPEVQEALQTGVGTYKRPSHTIGVELMYLAVSVPWGDGIPTASGIVRLAMPLHQINQTMAHVQRIVALASVAVGLVAIPFLFWMARRITNPIQQMSAVAGRIARGEFPRNVRIKASGELATLALALEDMSRQLQARIRELGKEKAEISAVLSSMTEGVLVVDAGGKIHLINQAFREQFRLGDEAIGKTVLEALRNVPLQELIAGAGQDGNVSAQELTFLNPDEQIFDVDAASLRGSDGAYSGTVIVFHNITRIKKLENLRKEFVANVSHELRTPLSILKGYVETLLDEHPPDPQTARQFLLTIQKNSRRLETLIDDLLTISAMESQQERLSFGPIHLKGATEAVLEELARQAAEKSIRVALEFPDPCPPARADARRLHQVLFNLLDNAIKYTQNQGRVTISAKETDGVLEVCFADNGPGIAAEHLPRIFERFYRVDKARSRDLGGTGLGLSIVKHIVQAHGGRVWAESEIDRGSRFYFTLPIAR